MMENVIEKHYVPTSGSGLDANLVAALMNNNNKSLDPATVALLRDNDKCLETAALANGGGMFGGAAIRELIDPIKKELSDIQCGLPKQPVPAIPVSCAYPYAGYGAGYAGYSGCGSCA